MDVLKNLTNLLGGHQSSAASTYNQQQPYNSQAAQPSGLGSTGGMSGLGGLGELLNPAVLGGLASALFPSNKRVGPTTGSTASTSSGMGELGGLGSILGSLMGSGALAGMFNHNDKASTSSPSIPGYTDRPSSIPVPHAQTQQDRVVRMLRALVFAAKSDGHIDQDEQTALNNQVQNMNLDPQAKTLLKQFMTEPLDPSLVANGVTDPQEAAQIYGLSCAITDMDNFMERSYLDGLATALGIPAQTKNAIEAQVKGGR